MLYHPQSLTLPLVHQNLEDRLSLGFNLSNIGPKLTYADPALADPIPMNLLWPCIKILQKPVQQRDLHRRFQQAARQ